MNDKRLVSRIIPALVSIAILACGNSVAPTILSTPTPSVLSYEQRIEAIMTRESGVINSLEKDDDVRESLLQAATLAFSIYTWETSIAAGNFDVASYSLGEVSTACENLGIMKTSTPFLNKMLLITQLPDAINEDPFGLANALKNSIYTDLYNRYENKSVAAVFDLTSLRLEIAFDLDFYAFQLKNNDNLEYANELFNGDVHSLWIWSGGFYEPGIEKKDELVNSVLVGELTVERIEQIQNDFDYWFDQALQYVLINN